MQNQVEVTEVVDDTEIAALQTLDELIGDMNTDGVNVDEIIAAQEVAEEESSVIEELPIEELPIDENTELDDAQMAALDADIERQENYQTQVSATVATVDPAVVKTSAKKTKTSKSANTGTPRSRSVDLATLPSELFVLTGDVTTMSAIDIEAEKVATLAARPTQVKIAEKFDNLFTSLNSGHKPSRYTQIAFELLDKNTNVTSSDIIAAYKAAGLGQGTAASQSGQMMELFSATGIAKRAGKELTINADSNLAVRIRAL